MGKYDFDKLTDRTKENSVKWEKGESELPMWVADMDFPTLPEVSEAIVERAKKGTFGYSVLPSGWAPSVVSWWKRRHDFEIDPEWLLFSTGVIPSLSSLIRRLAKEGEKVALFTPVYNVFFHCAENSFRKVEEVPLSYDGRSYSIPWEKLKKTLSDPACKVFILCNPHNPTGHAWNKEELQKIGEICKDNGVVVISDEIHCDLIDPGHSYVPFASVSPVCRDNSYTLISPGKAFNLAGIQGSAVIAPEKSLRELAAFALNADEVGEGNCFAATAMETAYEKGDEWLDELCHYIKENKDHVRTYIKSRIPDIHVVGGEATYLLWIDVSRIGDGKELSDWLRSKSALYVTDGDRYRGNGKDFIRMNVATQKSRVKEGLRRLEAGIVSLKRSKGR